MGMLLHYSWYQFQSDADAEVRSLLLPVQRAGFLPHLTWPDNVREAKLIREQFEKSRGGPGGKNIENSEVGGRSGAPSRRIKSVKAEIGTSRAADFTTSAI